MLIDAFKARSSHLKICSKIRFSGVQLNEVLHMLGGFMATAQPGYRIIPALQQLPLRLPLCFQMLPPSFAL